VAEAEDIIETAEEQDSEEETKAPSEVEETPVAGDELAALQQALEEAKAKECEYLDGWQRARAELANARKRFQREQGQAYTNARADVLARLLPIVDDFERAVETLPENLSGLTWIEGVMLILRKLQVLLDQDGVTPIEAVGQAFDPFAHQAVTHEPSEAVPEGHVIAELQRGYKMGDRVLRPSMVRVSSGSPPEPEAQPEPEDIELTEDDNGESS
jgi:molecular chaperone GrpE